LTKLQNTGHFTYYRITKAPTVICLVPPKPVSSMPMLALLRSTIDQTHAKLETTDDDKNHYIYLVS